MSPGLELAEGWHAALRRGQPVVAQWCAKDERLKAQPLAAAFRRLQPAPGPFYLLESQGVHASQRLSLITGEPLFVFLGNGRRSLWHSEGVLGELPLPPELSFHRLGRSLAELPLSEARAGLVPLVGTLAYEAGARFEKLPLAAKEPLGLPQWHFVLPSEWAVFEPLSGEWRFRMLLAGPGFFSRLHQALGSKPARDEGFPITDPEALLKDWIARCTKRVKLAVGSPPHPLPEPGVGALSTRHKDGERRGAGLREPRSNKGKRGFMAMVRRAKEHIAAGDIYQANLSHRFELETDAEAWPLYQRLSQIDPSPFAAYADLGDWQVVSASPERLFRQEGDLVEAWPIAGTIPRQGDDANAIARLRASAKDQAEHVMLVDLERNDLGRVCVGGSVQVPELMRVESASHVHHFVSRVRGRLKPGLELDDLLRAGFPGGSITGAPKIRCMEIIAQLEGERRGLYTGSLGYWDPWHRKADFNILIRTIFLAKGRAYWQVGGGIVADSDPEKEWAETLAKGEALRLALEGA